MDTTVKATRRKIIDIPEDIFRYLSVKAAMQGTNLKRYIEGLLAKDVEDMLAGMDDNDAYRWLSKNEPDGHVRVGEKERHLLRQSENYPAKYLILSGMPYRESWKPDVLMKKLIARSWSAMISLSHTYRQLPGVLHFPCPY